MRILTGQLGGSLHRGDATVRLTIGGRSGYLTMILGRWTGEESTSLIASTGRRCEEPVSSAGWLYGNLVCLACWWCRNLIYSPGRRCEVLVSSVGWWVDIVISPTDRLNRALVSSTCWCIRYGDRVSSTDRLYRTLISTTGRCRRRGDITFVYGLTGDASIVYYINKLLCLVFHS